MTLSSISSLIYASGPDCEDSNAVDYGTPDDEMDGFFMGANGCLYNPKLVSSDDIPVVGADYDNGQEPLFVINGANTKSIYC